MIRSPRVWLAWRSLTFSACGYPGRPNYCTDTEILKPATQDMALLARVPGDDSGTSHGASTQLQLVSAAIPSPVERKLLVATAAVTSQAVARCRGQGTSICL